MPIQKELRWLWNTPNKELREIYNKYKEEQKMENQQPNWKEIQPGIWKPEQEGDSIEGVLVSKRTEIGSNKSNAYDIETKKGQFMVWGSAILDDRMNFVNAGDMIRITFKGKEINKKKQPLNIFKVEKA